MYLSKRNKSILSKIFISNAHNSLIYNTPNLETTNRGMDKLIIEYHSAIKTHELLLIHAATWTNLREIMLNPTQRVIQYDSINI